MKISELKEVKKYILLVGIIVMLIGFGQKALAQSPIQVAGEPTITAVQSGDWTEAATWGGSLPQTDDRILIPSGATITVDAEIGTEFKSIRIAQGGKIQFARDVNTELRTEYLVSEMGGSLEIGTSSNKVAADVTAKLVFAELGGTSLAIDPERFAPGAVLMGPTKMHGATKTSWLTLSTPLSSGATQLELKQSPTGWKVGDKIVIAGTEPLTEASYSSVSEISSDETVEITGISGNTISFTPALTKNHKAPDQASDLDVHVANLSRNIVITSENHSVTSLPAASGGAPAGYRKPRGHLMFMHNLNVELRYVETNNIGRTDKTIILDDWEQTENEEGTSTEVIAGGNKNPRGRYSIHFHRGGLDDSSYPPKPIVASSFARVEGCAVNNDPGWAYVNHSAQVDFVKNVSYDVVGGAYNTEAGNELGSFIENIAIRTVNPGNPIMSAPRPNQSYVDGEVTNSLADLRETRSDFAWQGDGFWLHSAGVTVQGNVVSGCTGHAFVFWTEGLFERGTNYGLTRGDIDAHVPADEFPAQNEALKSWKATYPNFQLDIWYLQPRPFKDNTAYNFARGVQTYYTNTEFHRNADTEAELARDGGFNDLPNSYKDQLNFVADGTVLWNLGRVGFEHNHSTNITIKNSRVVGYYGATRTGFQNYGTNPAPTYVDYEPEIIGLDLDYYHNTHKWTLENNTVEGFEGESVGISLPKNAQVIVEGGTFNNAGTDIQINTPDQNLSNEEDGFGIGMQSVKPTKSIVTIQGNINFQNPNKNIVMNTEIILDEVAQKAFPVLFGAKEDRRFFTAPMEVHLNFGNFNNSRAYFNEQDLNFVPINDINKCAFSEPEVCVNNAYVNKTNSELGVNKFLGETIPEGAVNHPQIVGGKVTNVSSLTSQTISGFTALPNIKVGEIYTITGVSGGTSGNTVTFSSSDASVVSVNGNVLTAHKTGTVTITASQAGNDTHEAATLVEQSITVDANDSEKTTQTITGFTSIPNLMVNETYDINGVIGGDSGNPIIFVSSDANIISVDGNTITAIEVGTATITANQEGNDDYESAEPVNQSVSVISNSEDKIEQEIVGFDELPELEVGESYSIEGVLGGDSGNPIIFVSSDANIISVDGNTITAIEVGTATITANQEGNDDYESAEPVNQSVSVISNSEDKIEQEIVGFNELPDLNVDERYEITGVTGGASGNPIIFTSSDPDVISVEENILMANEAGLATITATQAGNEEYLTAEPVSQEIIVELVTSAKNFDKEELKVYPNPSTGVFTVDVLEPMEYTVINIQGALVSKGIFKFGQNSLNITSKGIHILRTTYDEHSKIFKLIVQ